jgi:hypothetical protein
MTPSPLARRLALFTSAFLAFAAAAPAALAQTADDRFVLRLSAFNPKASLGFSGNGTVTDGNDRADFEFSEGFDTSRSWRPRGAFGFRFSDRQAIVANYYDYRRNETWDYGGTVLDPGTIGAPGGPIEIPGASLDGHLALNLASINYEYSFISNDTLQWGLGLGVTWAELEADFSGSSDGTDLVDGQFETVRWKQDGFSPGLHTRLTWSPADRWQVGLEAQYLDTGWGNFLDEDGHFERGGLFVEYMVSPRVGVHVGYDWFRLKLSDDYRGTARAPDGVDEGPFPYEGRISGDLRVHGPVAGLSFRF